MKKALVKDVTSVIIAVLGLVIISYTIYQIYSLSVSNSETKKAQHALDLIDARISAIAANEHVAFPLQGAASWALVGWNIDESTRPEKCTFKSCICACPDSTSTSKSSKIVVSKEYLATLSTSCQEKGICRAYETPVSVGTDVLITYTGYSNALSGEHKLARFGEANQPLTLRKISFPKNLLELDVSKSDAGISVRARDMTENKYELFDGAP